MNPRANRGIGADTAKIRQRWPRNLGKDHNNTQQKNLSERGKGRRIKRITSGKR